MLDYLGMKMSVFNMHMCAVRQVKDPLLYGGLSVSQP